MSESGQAGGSGVSAPTDLQQVLQLLMEDRRQREEEIAAERRQREEDIARERRQREEETERRLREMQQHVDSLLQVVGRTQEARGGHSLGAGSSHGDKEAKVSKLSDEDDIEAYLTTFERMMVAYGVPKDRWVFKVAPQLTGKAQQAYAAMAAEDTGDYDQLKAAIFQRYSITEETYRVRFRSVARAREESYTEMATRVMDLARKWTRKCTDADSVREVIAVEQLLNSMPVGLRIWVRERKPKTVAEAGRLADDYAEARGPLEGRRVQEAAREPSKTVSAGPRQCYACGKPGHLAKDCLQKSVWGVQPKAEPGTRDTKQGDREGVRCFRCHQKGHFANRCPSQPALLCYQVPARHEGPARAGAVEETPVEGILLDTGAANTMIHRDLVPVEKISQEMVDIRCAHGDVVSYPLAEVSMRVGDYTFSVQAAVSDRLPVPVLLGRDVPGFDQLLGVDQCGDSTKAAKVVAVTTRSQRRQEELSEVERMARERESGAMPSSLEEAVMPFSELDDDLFTESRGRPKLTKSQKRGNKRKRFPRMQEDPAEHPLEVSREDLVDLQETDKSLEPVWRQVQENPDGVSSRGGFFMRDGVLYRTWMPVGGEAWREVEQLVLPQQCRRAVLELAHSIPLAGHLGKKKTAQRLLQRFYWPTLFKDVDEYCRGCAECQKTAPGRQAAAPLIPLPIVDSPFERIAMDIVGPLPRSRTGNRYVLVVCDYATRWPEAVPLKSIDAGHVAEELMVLFSRVGVPKEILTDQGSNFTSQLLKEVYRLLSIKPIRTSPYHPQTDGLVERFNQTLKAMLRRTATDEGKDWDKLIPYVLFAYREVPQSSTGFSPFELVYGHAVRGPLDVLKETWESHPRSSESIVSYVLSVQERLAKMSALARENLQKAQKMQKRWYDQHAREREFSSGENVLVLLPTSSNKLLAKWMGPYPVLRKVSPVSYEVDMYDHAKRKRIFHVNMLRKWHSPVAVNLWAEGEAPGPDPDEIVLWKDEPALQEAAVSEKLSEIQQEQLQGLLEEYHDVLRGAPGRTDMAEHVIDTGDSRPIRLHPYRVPHAYRGEVERQVTEMLEEGVIEPSTSDWAAPIVLVRKKDGTLRFCVDYRKLNGQSKVDPYPMPRVDELIDKLGHAKFLTTLDLARGYWQVPMAASSREKTAFVTAQGLFQFTVMPFGLQGAPATFQRMMDRLITGMGGFCAAYLDDLVVYSESWEEHLEHLSQVLGCLRKAGLTAKPSKCQFAMDQCVYLGHTVGNGVVQPELSKVEAVQRWPVPETKKQVRAFLGLTGYYRKFIPQYASIAAPLTDLTKKFAPTSIAWTAECDAAFKKLKSLLCSSPVLYSPDFGEEFVLQTDASDRGVGAVLSQLMSDGKEHPIAYYSRKLLPREERYSTVEKECLAVKLGIQAFRVYLLGRPFQIQTDHRSLVWLDRLKESNTRLARWSLALQPYQFTVTYRPGSSNGNADALSRAGQARQTALSQEKGGGV